MSDVSFAGRRCALIVGHPGHELRVLGWMTMTRPIVAVLTDGGGHHGRSRLELSREVCRRAGALPSEHFGLVTDAAIYAAILAGDTGLFVRIADTLAEWLSAARIDVVAGDAVEGYNPTHDLCRAIIDRAVRQASSARAIEVFAFELTGAPRPPAPHMPAVPVVIGDTGLRTKIDACRAYGEAVGGTLLREIEEMLARYGPQGFACEYLLRHDPWSMDSLPAGHRPYYEVYGEQQVAAGHYQTVIRHDTHIAPIVRALQA